MSTSVDNMIGPLKQLRTPPRSSHVIVALGVGCCLAIGLAVWLATTQAISLEALVGGIMLCVIVVGGPFRTPFGQQATVWWFGIGPVGQTVVLIMVSMTGWVLVGQEIVSTAALGSVLLGWLLCLIAIGFDALRR